MEEKSSSEILDEMFRELEEKSAKGELNDNSDLSEVLGNTIVNAEVTSPTCDNDNNEKGVKRKGKHKHSKHKSKKSKKHKKKSKNSSERKKQSRHSSEENAESLEDGEIQDDDLQGDEKTNNKQSHKSKTHKSDHNHDKSEHKTNGKLKESSSHHLNSVSDLHGRHRHRSRSNDRYDNGHKRNRRSRSRSRGHGESCREKRHRSRSGSVDRSYSKEPKRKKLSPEHHHSKPKERRSNSLEDENKIDKAKLLEAARKNALVMLAEGRLPKLVASEKLKSDQVASIRAGGKSVEELTDFCKLLSDKEKEEIRHKDYLSEDEDHPPPETDDDKSAPFIHHPFKLKDPPAPIIMKIKSAVQLPNKTLAEKVADSATLRLQFPVSSGTQHRSKEWVPVTPSKPDKEKPKVKVVQEIPEAPVEDKVFPDAQACPPLDIGSIVSDRLKAIRALDENPHDVQALGLMYKSQQQMQYWATSKQLPGQFTGSTGVQILSPQELAGPSSMQAWVRKDQFQRATPVQSGFGMFMLQKMGWKPGEGLGKNKEGTCEPLNIEIKLDKKGLVSEGEIPRKPIIAATCKDLSAKHPVSALVELCNKRKWLPPDFTLVHDSGPDHRKNFLFKVHVNGVDYQPTIASLNKKHARAQAATVCLQSMGLLPKDIEVPG